MKIILGIAILCVGLSAQAQSRKLSIKSGLDNFELIVNSRTKGSVNGKPTTLKAMEELWPVVDNPLGNECPKLKGNPDVTVTENGKARALYVKQGIVTDGKFCLNVGGEGLLFFPVHRDFFIGKSRDSIALESPLKIFRQGVKIADLRKLGDQWSNLNKEQLLNWDFIERFENSLRDFDIRLRVQPEIAQNKAKMIIQSGNQTYEFYKITKVLWAVKKPGSPWLEASDDWSFWYDLEPSLVEDRLANEIRLLESPTTPPEELRAIMDKLKDSWSPNLRDSYIKLALNPSFDPDLQRMVLERLKRKPSLETAGAMVEFLNQSTNEELKRIAGQILKTQNPKGPLYKPNLSASEKNKVFEYWNSWWKQNKKIK